MSKALSKQTSKHEFTVDQYKLICDTIARGATPNELELFLHRCKVMKIDPLRPGRIHFIKYGQNPGSIVIGIEEFRTRADKTGKHVGTQRGVIRNETGQCIGAWAEVYRDGWTKPAREEVSLAEYNTGKANWLKMPETMIKKVAEAAALRIAFPDECGGLYSEDEMQQAESERHDPVAPPAPVQAEIVEPEAYDPGDEVAGFGFHKDKRLRDMTERDIKGALDFIRTKDVKTPAAVRFAEIASLYLNHAEMEAQFKGATG